MITESDVRAVLAEQARDISEPDDILARLTIDRQPGRLAFRGSVGRRRWLAPVAAAAAVAAVVAGVTLASTHHKPAQQTHKKVQPAGDHTLPPMGGVELRYFGSIGHVPHYQIGQPVFASDRQRAEVSGYGVAEIGDVTVYSAGAFDPATIKDAQQVTMGGIQALFGTVMVTVSVPSNHVVPTPTLAWQFGSGRWIAITGWWPTELAVHHLQLDALTEAKKIAAAIDTSVTRPFLIPFRVGYLPSGLRRSGAQYGMPTRLHSVFVNFRAVAGPDQIDVSTVPSRKVKPPAGSFLVNGHPAWIYPAQMNDAKHPGKVISKTLNLAINFGQILVVISSTNDPRDVLLKIGRSISVARDINDPSTWFDAAK